MSEGNVVTEEAPVEEAQEKIELIAAAAPIVPRSELLASRELARQALAEITDAASIGEPAGEEVHDESTVTLFFECALPGYPGWRWAAALAKVDDEAPVTVLEVELLPGEEAVLAPEWVPWSQRLSQYRETQARQAAEEAEAAEHAAEELSEFDDSDDDPMENDYDDFEDIDGVDIDSLDEDADDEDADDEEADDDDAYDAADDHADDAADDDADDDDDAEHDGDDEEE